MWKRFVKKSMITFLSAAVVFANAAVISYADSLDADLIKLKNMIRTVRQNYVEEVSEEELMYGAYSGVFQMLDPHSIYYSPEEMEIFESVTTGKFGGIGLLVEMRESKLIVVTPIEGTPAQKAGILPGDIILSVDGETVQDIPFNDVVERMQGEPGTKITLEIEREGEQLTFELTRDWIPINPIRHQVLENNIGYIKIEQFNENTADYFERAFNELLEQDVKGFILDLRDNPGGLVSQAVHVLDPFVPKGPVAYLESRGKIIETHYSEKDPIQKPLVVLINENSASAAELIAGAVQDMKSGTVVGTRSYGKGTVQTVFSSADGSGFKLTVATYLTPNKREVEGLGIEPDIVVQNHTGQEWKQIENFAPMLEESDAALGDRGLNVYGAQQRLKFIGYTDVSATGILDEMTQNAILDFQNTHALPPTGILDAPTREKISEKVLNILANGKEDLQLQKAIEIIDKQS